MELVTRNADALGNAGGYVEIVEELDITTIGTTKQFLVPGEVLGYNIVSVQAEWSGMTGTLNGTVDLIQSNKGVSFDLLGAQVIIDSAAESGTVNDKDFSGRFLGVLFTKGGLTGGLLTLTAVVKAK